MLLALCALLGCALAAPGCAGRRADGASALSAQRERLEVPLLMARARTIEARSLVQWLDAGAEEISTTPPDELLVRRRDLSLVRFVLQSCFVSDVPTDASSTTGGGLLDGGGMLDGGERWIDGDGVATGGPWTEQLGALETATVSLRPPIEGRGPDGTRRAPCASSQAAVLVSESRAWPEDERAWLRARFERVDALRVALKREIPERARQLERDLVGARDVVRAERVLLTNEARRLSRSSAARRADSAGRAIEQGTAALREVEAVIDEAEQALAELDRRQRAMIREVARRIATLGVPAW